MTDRFLLNEAVSPGIQLRTLRRLFQKIREAAQAGLAPVVEVDLDLTSVMPVHRTREALLKAAGDGRISLFTEPDLLPVLPGYSDEAWMEFVRGMKLESLYPEIAWQRPGGVPDPAPDGPFAVFHRSYWETSLIRDDTPTPGLGSFVTRVREYGGEVVFLSGRWLAEQVQPTLESLSRAGIPDPKLVIGNPRHPELVAPELALSDSAIKVIHQEKVQAQYGKPIAIVDDRRTNRSAIVNHLGNDVLSIGICIPGFTFDPVSRSEPLRISTFETFDQTLEDEPRRPYMRGRYKSLGIGSPWRGLYEGLGRNGLPYALPKTYSEGPVLTSDPAPFADLIASHRPGTLSERDFVELCSRTIPQADLDRIDRCLDEAEALAARGLAAPFALQEKADLRLGTIASWLHSRDVEHVMRALGFNLAATGIHDIEEFVDGSEIKAAMTSGGARSEWIRNWVDSIDAEERVNVGCLNPSMAAGMWFWTPEGECQDAMDVHRLSSHHEGDAHERYDPVEAAVNNVLHQREGMYGIRKEPIHGWNRLLRGVRQETAAEALGKSSVSRDVIRDAIRAGRELELAGALTPWGLVAGADFE